MARNRRFIHRRRFGVTLLELILALSLSVLVVSAIGMAINLHFKMLDVRRTSLEEMSVVHAVTKRMTDDIRTIVQPNEPDLSGLETALQSAMQAANAQLNAAAGGGTGGGAAAGATGQTGGGGGAGGGGGGGGGQGGGGQAGGGGQGGGGGQAQGGQQSAGGQPSGGGASGGQGGGSAGGGGQSTGGGASGGNGGSAASGASSSTAATDTASTTATTTTVQLIGSATELRFDISRLPRVDQYKGMLSAKGEPSPVDLPSDVKTIVYFLRSDTSAASYAGNPNATGGEASTDGYGRGLMRAELDRAVSSWAETNGAGTESMYSSAQLLADEVVGLGFEYYDGTDWLTDWDSSSQGLPRAIRIWLSVKPTYGMSEQELAQAAAGKQPQPTDFYFVVNLPTAPLVAAATTDTTDTTASGAASGQSTGTSAQGTTP